MIKYNSMAAPAKLEPIAEYDLESTKPQPVDPVRRKAAELYGLGHSRKEVAGLLAYHLDKAPERPLEVRIRTARRKLRRWEKDPAFRDMVWDMAVIELDMSTPEILRGVARKAKRGRIDAAKLALSITGRHKEKDDNRPSAIQINIGAMPRPARQAVDPQADITLEASEVDED